MKTFFQRWGLPLLTVFTFFYLLGGRSLNEPDEGRYSEIAREMIETGDWLVPHLWYIPHLDKPPMTYWIEAASMKCFGRNEWAVRLPLALAGIGGVWAAFLLGCSVGGRRVGVWAALILQSSLLFFVMARMLTTDIYLTLFTTWAIYFFWRSHPVNAERGVRNAEHWKWNIAGWVALAFGFLTKGPVALAIPAAAFGALMIYRRDQITVKNFLSGAAAGLVVFLALAAPWFIAVFRTVPASGHFMVFGQAAGHLLGTTIKDRGGSPFYFFAILLVGLMPWTIWLGWLWRRAHWRSLDDRSKAAWLVLSVWTIFTFTLFSLSRSKLPAYILPIFPALSVLLAWRFFDGEERPSFRVPGRISLACSLLLLVVLPLALRFGFRVELPLWLIGQTAVAGAVLLFVHWRGADWDTGRRAATTVALTLLGFYIVLPSLPRFENAFRGNQTMKPLGALLRENYQPGDAVICWGRLPQGLPFYAGGVISATNRPYFGGMDLAQMPFRFPGNRERLGDHLLPDDDALIRMAAGDRRIWIVAYGTTFEKFEQAHRIIFRPVAHVGQWELFSNR